MVAVYCRSDNFEWLVPNWVLSVYWTRKNRIKLKSRFFVQNRIEIDRLAKISYRHSTTKSCSEIWQGFYAAGSKTRQGWEKLRISSYMTLYLRNGTRQWQSYYKTWFVTYQAVSFTNNFEWPLTPVSRSQYFSKMNISKNVLFWDKVV